MWTNATLIQVLSKAAPAGDAVETIASHIQSHMETPEPTADDPDAGKVAPELAATVVPPFVAKMLCFALPLLKKLVKLSGDQSDAVDTLIALVCGLA